MRNQLNLIPIRGQFTAKTLSTNLALKITSLKGHIGFDNLSPFNCLFISFLPNKVRYSIHVIFDFLKLAQLEIFVFSLVLRLRGKIVPPIMAQSNKFVNKNLIFIHNQLRKSTSLNVGAEKLLVLVYLLYYAFHRRGG